MWNVLTVVVASRELSHLIHEHSRKHHLRVLLRGASPGVLSSILHGHFQSACWHGYVCGFVRQIWSVDQSPSDFAYTYAVISHECTTWYVGRTSLHRKIHGQQWSGLVARSREHCLATFLGQGGQEHRPRYKAWQRCSRWSLCMVPTTQGKAANIARYETLQIDNCIRWSSCVNLFDEQKLPN